MDSKLLAVLLAVLGTLSVLYTQYNANPELSPFEAWKAEYGVKYDSMFE
jgi:outer membrane cobalamin receptor